MTKIEKKSLSVGKYVDNKHVDTVIRTYKHERWVQNSERIGKEDSLSAWYSVEELEEFIANSKDHGADGIKLYFAAYPADFAEKPEYAGRQTIVLVATKSKETTQGTINKDIYLGTEKNPQILAYNLSRICPPLCYKSPDGDIGLTIVDRGEKGLMMI
ncbi:MAG TPA: hypothetical protein VK543_02855 [Puia sp.]|nr:hypothetical protein [Puia sp.]